MDASVRFYVQGRKRLEQLCRYITRPALSDERVQLNAAGQVELKLKTPWRDGTTHLVMSPLEFMQRLAARATEGRPSGSCAAAAVASDPVPRRAGTQREAAGTSGAARAARAGASGHRGSSRRRVRSRDGPGPAESHRLGAVAQARLRHRHAALPTLRRRGAEDHRGHPGAAGDREDPHPSGAEPGHKQSSGLFVPGEGPGHWPGAACKAGSTAAAKGTGAPGGARLRYLSRADRQRHLAPGCADNGSQDGAAPPVGSMPMYSGSTLMFRRSEPQSNRMGRPNHDKTTVQMPVPGRPGRRLSAAHASVGLPTGFQRPFEIPMRGALFRAAPSA